MSLSKKCPCITVDMPNSYFADCTDSSDQPVKQPCAYLWLMLITCCKMESKYKIDKSCVLNLAKSGIYFKTAVYMLSDKDIDEPSHPQILSLYSIK